MHNKENPLLAIEKPITMATQMYFLKNNYPDTYYAEKNKVWFNYPKIKEFLEIITPYLDDNRPLD